MSNLDGTNYIGQVYQANQDATTSADILNDSALFDVPTESLAYPASTVRFTNLVSTSIDSTAGNGDNTSFPDGRNLLFADYVKHSYATSYDAYDHRIHVGPDGWFGEKLVRLDFGQNIGRIGTVRIFDIRDAQGTSGYHFPTEIQLVTVSSMSDTTADEVLLTMNPRQGSNWQDFTNVEIPTGPATRYLAIKITGLPAGATYYAPPRMAFFGNIYN